MRAAWPTARTSASASEAHGSAASCWRERPKVSARSRATGQPPWPSGPSAKTVRPSSAKCLSSSAAVCGTVAGSSPRSSAKSWKHSSRRASGEPARQVPMPRHHSLRLAVPLRDWSTAWKSLSGRPAGSEGSVLAKATASTTPSRDCAAASLHAMRSPAAVALSTPASRHKAFSSSWSERSTELAERSIGRMRPFRCEGGSSACGSGGPNSAAKTCSML
mmetsp:Transcript_115734/g.369307  ORF Transcript_115734/g.369307 Transcript_115734/m.369307 type:complete len:219 (-) Transcript_115734:291-947(-)